MCHLVMGKFIPKDQWREQETIDRFSKVLTDKMAEVKSMLADGLTIDTINQVWGERDIMRNDNLGDRMKTYENVTRTYQKDRDCEVI